MPTPSISVKVMHEVPAADDEYAFIPERCQFLADLKMKRRRPRLINAELHDRNIGLRV